jgi:hypothetical protein
VVESEPGAKYPYKGNACGPCRVQLAEDLAVVAKERENVVD